MISVVVLAHKEGEAIIDCLQSLASQKFSRGSIQLIIVLNNASANTNAAVAHWCSTNRNSSMWRSLQIIHSDTSSVANGRNFGWAHAESEFIAFVDGDCIVDEFWLATLAQKFRELQLVHPRLAALGFRPSPHGLNSFGNALSIMQSCLLGHLNSPQAKPISRLTLVDHVPTSNVLFCARALAEVQGFDPNFSFVCEDVELGYSLQKAGFCQALQPGGGVRHLMKQTVADWAARMWRFGFGQVSVWQKHPEHFRIRTLLAFLFFPVMAGSVVLVLFGWYTMVWMPVLYLCAVLGSILSVRAEIHSLSCAVRVCFAFVLTHVAYSFGMMHGISLRALLFARGQKLSLQKSFIGP